MTSASSLEKNSCTTLIWYEVMFPTDAFHDTSTSNSTSFPASGIPKFSLMMLTVLIGSGGRASASKTHIWGSGMRI